MFQFIRTVFIAIVSVAKFILSSKLTKLFPPKVRPIVEVRQGKLRGVTATLPNGSPYHFFKGVPYAKPPVGELRFRAPVPIEKFYKPVVDCLVDRSLCIQPLGKFSIGKEAGLFLNVYTPGLPREDDGKQRRYPVMVWIHGGGFMSGGGDSFVYDPVYIVQEEVVVVTMNYRLGPLGFLCLPKAGIEGNAGLKDQLLVFKWVKDNISHFGGDPDNVTVFGESAGSMSAYLHYLSPNSRKYFHKVICQSGVACSESSFQANATEKARKLASRFGYDGTDEQKILETLRKAPANLLIQNQPDVGSEHEKRLALQMLFRPVIEENLTEDSIITELPEQILKKFNTIQIPIITGCNDGEGILCLKFILNRLKEFDQDAERLVPQLMGNPPGLDKKAVGQEIRRFYFGDKPIDKRSLDEMCDLMSDNTFITNTVVSTEWIAKYQPNVKQFHYRFNYDGRFSFGKKIFNLSQVKGASHGDDIFYLFRSKMLPELPESSDECQIRQLLVRLWTNFAKHSDPTPDCDDPALPFKWTPVKSVSKESESFDLDALEIDLQPRMVANPCKERMQLWRNYLRTYRKGFL